MQFRFKQEIKNVNIRKQLSECLIKKYPDKIPIICEKDPNSKIKDLEKTKYIIPKDFTVSHFSILLRNKLELKSERSFFLLAKGKYAIVGETRFDDIYERYADKGDGFLYIFYAQETFWGGT